MRPLALALVSAAIAVVAPTGCKNDRAPSAGDGPVYTPGHANAIRSLAQDCEIRRSDGKTDGDGVVEVHSCKGKHGTVTISLAAGDRLEHVHVKLREMVPFLAKNQIGFGLGPLVGPELTEQLRAIVDKLPFGQRESVQVGKTRAEVFAGGSAKTMPSYEVRLTW